MSDITEWAVDALKPLGPVRSRRMFGGVGIFMDDRMFVLIADEELYIKSDAETDARFEDAGCEKFTYEKGNHKKTAMNYRRLPDSAYDDEDELREWAELGIGAATRAKK